MSEFSLVYENFDCSMENAGARWVEWIDDFELYLAACNITTNAKVRRRAALLHCGGKELRRIYDVMKHEKDDYDDIKEKLMKYFEPQRNKRFERLKFRQAKQEPDESIDAFVSRLKYLAKYCEYEDVNDQIIDQLVVFCSSGMLKKKILEKKEITLDRILEISRTMETVNSQVKEIGGDLSDMDEIKAEVNAVRGMSFEKKCVNCSLRHKMRECPAYGEKCRACGKIGHYERCCNSSFRNADSSGLKQRKALNIKTRQESSSSENESSDEFESRRKW